MNQHITANGQIVGVVTAVPRNVITNEDCPNPEAADEAAKMTGVVERRWVKQHQSARTLCTDAARRLINDLRWPSASVDVLVYVTQTPEGAVPADVYRIAADLGLPERCLCLQINLSCSGYVYGMLTTMRLLEPDRRALLLVGDATSTICDPGDRATAPLFGDAGSATAIVGGVTEQHFDVGSDGRGADKLAAGSPPEACWLKMDGAAVFNFTLKHVPQIVSDVLSIEPAPDFLLFHQANAWMLKHLAKKSEVAHMAIPSNIARFGNTSCASIPLLMCDPALPVRARLLNDGASLALFGYGAGWAWAGAAIACEPMACVELIEV